MHPGTLDVDLLFRHAFDVGSIRPLIAHFLESGFIPSAKHPFQLIRTQRIRDQHLAFNVDLLHPTMMSDPANAGMFVDHLELDVPLTNAEAEFKKVASVVLPNSGVLFSEGLFSEEQIDGVPFNLVSFDGMFITKMDSCQKQKRERDSFDIYLGFLGGGISSARLTEIAQTDARVSASLGKFVAFLRADGERFDTNVRQFADAVTQSPSELILSRLL